MVNPKTTVGFLLRSVYDVMIVGWQVKKGNDMLVYAAIRTRADWGRETERLRYDLPIARAIAAIHLFLHYLIVRVVSGGKDVAKIGSKNHTYPRSHFPLGRLRFRVLQTRSPWECLPPPSAEYRS